MKIYEIIDEEMLLSVGVLLYYEKEKTFIIELADDLDEWNAPLLLTRFVKNRIFTIPRDISRAWVNERIIPSGRQNIGAILNTHRLKSYDEMRLLELSQGRCSQDNMYIKKIEELPFYVIERRKRNLLDCMAIEDDGILCFFVDGLTKKVTLASLVDIRNIDKITANLQLFESCRLGTDGYYLTFNDSIDIMAGVLYERGEVVPVSYADFISFAGSNTVDTSKACAIMGCTRQNLAYMTDRGMLTPVQENLKGNLYLKRDILKNLW